MNQENSIEGGGNNPKSTAPVTILVVDDEVLLRLSMASEFRKHGYTAIEAASADEALSILQSGAVVHAILTDIRMPGSLDGLGLVRRVHAEWPEIRMVVTSGSVPRVDLRQIGVAGFFPKPYKISAIIRLIAAVVDPLRMPVRPPRANSGA
jgi:CheY-like chemotaxis protein